MNLSDLKTSVSELSDEELSKLLTEIRLSRRTQKASNRKAASATGAKKANGSASMEALLGALSPDQLAELLSKMGGKS